MTRGIVVAVLAALISLTFGVPCAAAAAPAYAPETLLAGGAAAQSAPALGPGSLAAWEEQQADGWHIVFSDPLGLLTLPGAGDRRHPVLTDQGLAYECTSAAGDLDIAYCRVSDLLATPDPYGSGPETIVGSGAGDQLDPAMGWGRLVYVDASRGKGDIVLYTVATGESRYLTSSTAAQIEPATDGGTVVWADHRNGNWDIYAYNINTKRTTRLTSDPSSQRAPQVLDGRVVYQDHRNGNWDIYSCDLKGHERRLTRDKRDQTAPQLDPSVPGNVVFVNGSGADADIYVRESKTGIIKPVCTEPGAQTSPAFLGDRVVWADQRDGQSDVYQTDLVWPAMTFRSNDSTTGYNGTASFHGQLMVGGSTGAGLTVKVAGAGRSWTLMTASDGSFDVTLSNVKRKVTLRAWFPGDADHLPAWGGTSSVMPQAWLSTPKMSHPPFTGIVSLDHTDFIVTGYLKPRHPAGTKAVYLTFYYLDRDTWEWESYKTVKVAVSDYGTYSRYRSPVVRLPRLDVNKWRVQASHSDADHAYTESAMSKTY